MKIRKSVAIRYIRTHGDKKLHTLLVKYFNDLLDGQKSQRSIDKVTYFYVGDLFCIHLGTKYANFQEKIFATHFSNTAFSFVILCQFFCRALVLCKN